MKENQCDYDCSDEKASNCDCNGDNCSTNSCCCKFTEFMKIITQILLLQPNIC